MSVRFRDSEPTPPRRGGQWFGGNRMPRPAGDPDVKVRVTCDRCPWSKPVLPEKVAHSLRGHYGYAHPERRLPTPAQCIARTTPWTPGR
jgi:hypothetical protein